jgi:hypothetical protein
LLPRILRQIEDHYPGTKLSISEYNYGGGKTISGAIAQADVLGLFGRYGLFAACNWGIGPADQGQIAGFKAFLDFDGSKARFGDMELPVKGETPQDDSVYAALDSNDRRRLTIVAINKTGAAMPMRFSLGTFKVSKVRAFTATADSLPNLKAAQASAAGSTVIFSAPPLSVTTLEVRS